MTYLTTEFFERDVVEVAREMVGCVLEVTAQDGTQVTGRIVETEAYGGEDDPASHAGRGRTPRSAIMYGPPGVAYVYLIYGVHHCLNVVTGPEETASAVLIRSVEPLQGRNIMAARRGMDPLKCRDRDLTAGPGRLCRALGIDLGWNGMVFVGEGGNIGIRGPHGVVETASSPRIGITKAIEWPHRFVDPASLCLSF